MLASRAACRNVYCRSTRRRAPGPRALPTGSPPSCLASIPRRGRRSDRVPRRGAARLARRSISHPAGTAIEAEAPVHHAAGRRCSGCLPGGGTETRCRPAPDRVLLRRASIRAHGAPVAEDGTGPPTGPTGRGAGCAERGGVAGPRVVTDALRSAAVRRVADEQGSRRGAPRGRSGRIRIQAGRPGAGRGRGLADRRASPGGAGARHGDGHCEEGRAHPSKSWPLRGRAQASPPTRPAVAPAALRVISTASRTASRDPVSGWASRK
jgi:hypothetical protein